MSIAARLKGALSITTKIAVLAALVFAIASRYGESHSAVLLTVIVGVALNVIAIRSKHLVFDLFTFGLVFHAAAFYWLPDTLAFFGGFPTPISLLLFALFCIVSSLQLIFVALVQKRLSRSVLEAFGLAFPLAWMVGEFLIPRLFPWSLVHPLISWKLFSGLAAFIGVTPLSALLLWWSRLFLMLIPSRAGGIVRSQMQLGAIAVSVLIASGLSVYQSSALDESLRGAPKVKVALIQGNLSATQKGDVRMLTPNLERYRTLSTKAVADGAQLVIWPESVMNVWTQEDAAEVRGTRFDPYPGATVPLLYGGLSFRKLSNEDLDRQPPTNADMLFDRFNTAFGINEKGSVLGRYHKRVLMPFGEYMPFSKTFPSIKELSPHSGDFSVGDRPFPIPFPLPGGSGTYLVSNLICYEDLVPSLSLDGVKRGANILVNLTNDAWYGPTAAPYQHHLLAAWRAIETGRYLLRATNTGYTAIVDPYGKTVASLPIFEEGVLIEDIAILSHSTPYLRIGDGVAWVLCALAAAGWMLTRNRGTRPQD